MNAHAVRQLAHLALKYVPDPDAPASARGRHESDDLHLPERERLLLRLHALEEQRALRALAKQLGTEP